MAMTEDRRVGMPDSRSFRERLRSLVMESDLVCARFMLMTCALLQGIAFLTSKATCPYVACRFLDDVMPYQGWAYLFLSYALLKLWRIFDGTSRPTAAKIINGFGASLFGAFATSLLVARWPFWILVVPYVVLAFTAVWVFARTAIYPGRGFRAD